jgi:putative addiction module killer protein
MIEIRRTREYLKWLRSIRDVRAQTAIAARVDRLARGNPGDVKPVGHGVSELRIHFGPGYRVYYMQRGNVLILLLCGGDKSSQTDDISKAHTMVRELED